MEDKRQLRSDNKLEEGNDSDKDQASANSKTELSQMCALLAQLLEVTTQNSHEIKCINKALEFKKK